MQVHGPRVASVAAIKAVLIAQQCLLDIDSDLGSLRLANCQSRRLRAAQCNSYDGIWSVVVDVALSAVLVCQAMEDDPNPIKET